MWVGFVWVFIFGFLSFFVTGAVVFVEAGFAESSAAVGAFAEAGGTEGFVAGHAATEAIVADHVIAAVAAGAAVFAEVSLADVAPVERVAAGTVATLVARLAVPVIQGDIGALGVVGRQHGPHEEQGVADPTLRQSSVNRSDGLAETGTLVADVWVRNAAVTTGWVWIECDALECLTSRDLG